MDYEDPVAIAIFAPTKEIERYPTQRKLELLLSLSANGRLTDAEFRRFAQACAGT